MKPLILLIDDDPIAHLINKRIITRSFPDDMVKEFLSASQALEFLKNLMQPETFHFIIFLDIHMPEISGWEFIAKIENKYHLNYQIYLLTSSVNPKDKEKAQTYDKIKSLIEKPFSFTKLEELDLSPEIFL